MCHISNDLTAKNQCTFVCFCLFIAQLRIKKSVAGYYDVLKGYGKSVEFKYC